jgi:hypothetical protein
MAGGTTSLVRVTTNWREVYRYLDRAARRQVPFASALALTRLAQLGQLRVRANLPSRFHLRSGWVSGGIRVIPARKGDWPRQFSAVGSRDDFMALQETGGTKRPRKAASLAIPGLSTARGAGGRISRGQRPRALLRKRRYFTQRLGAGMHAGQIALLHRLTSERYPLRVVFLFTPEGQIRPTLRMHEDVESRARSQYAVVFKRALTQALASGLPRRPG